MRLLFDAYANLSGSRLRGIRRYEYSLMTKMLEIRGRNELKILANGIFQAEFDEFRKNLNRVSPSTK